MFKKIILVSSLMLVFAANSFALDVDSAVNDYCKCVKPLYDKMEEVNDALKAGNFAKMQAMGAEMQGMTEKVMACSQEMQSKYASVKDDSEFSAKVSAGIDKQCPQPNPIGQM